MFRLTMFMSVVLFVSPAIADSPFLRGRVTDERGRGIEGATVTIHDCVVSCIGNTSRLTDNDGLYVFQAKPGRNEPMLGVSMPGRYVVSITSSGEPLKTLMLNEPRVADIILGTPAEAGISIHGEVPEGWDQRVVLRPKEGGTLLRYEHKPHKGFWSQWVFTMIPRNEPYRVVLIRTPKAPAAESLEEQVRNEPIREQKRIEISSPPISFSSPQRYRVDLEIEASDGDAGTRLVFTSVTDAVEKDRKTETTGHQRSDAIQTSTR